jgi:hypothetical protein
MLMFQHHCSSLESLGTIWQLESSRMQDIAVALLAYLLIIMVTEHADSSVKAVPP